MEAAADLRRQAGPLCPAPSAHGEGVRNCTICWPIRTRTRIVAAEHPDVVARLAAKLQEWWPVTRRQTLWSHRPLEGTTWTEAVSAAAPQPAAEPVG